MTGPLPFRLAEARAPQMGLIILQADETIELDFRRLFRTETEWMVTRIPSGLEVTPETLAAMEAKLGESAALLPDGARLSCLAYACTSGSAAIGPARVAQCLHEALPVAHVTDPVSALVAACRHLEIRSLAVLSPYIEPVSRRLFDVLRTAGIETPAFGSFEIAEEARVVRIEADSIIEAATSVMDQGDCDGLFLSCTNLRTLDVLEPLEAKLGKPVLSSNQVLAWHMAHLTGLDALHMTPGALFRA